MLLARYSTSWPTATDGRGGSMARCPPRIRTAPFRADALRQDPLDSLLSRVFTMLRTPLTDLYTSRPRRNRKSRAARGYYRNLLWGVGH